MSCRLGPKPRSGMDDTKSGSSDQQKRNNKLIKPNKLLKTMTIGRKEKPSQQSTTKAVVASADSGQIMENKRESIVNNPAALKILKNICPDESLNTLIKPKRKTRSEELHFPISPCFGSPQKKRKIRNRIESIPNVDPRPEEKDETESSTRASIQSERRSAICTSINLLDTLYNSFEEILLDQ